MSDETETGTVVSETSQSLPPPSVASAGAGALLRQAREAAGLQLADLAVALKVSVKKLEALESDRLDLLPDAVFVRALASSVCRTLKIDAAPVLGLLPQTAVPRLEFDEAGLKTPFRTQSDVAKAPFWDRLSRPMVLAALTVLVGALVLIFFPSTQQRAEIGAIVARTPAQAPVEPSTVVVAAPPVAASPQEASRAHPAPAAQPAPAAADVTPRAAAPAATAEEAPAVRRKLPSTGVVVFKTRDASWVEVTDANGAIQLSRLIEPGEVIGASGPLPLNVTVGRADVTEVQVRGQPFSLDGVTRQNVARFEVK